MVTEESLKLYYSIGEVAEMFGVNTSLIRFWEKRIRRDQPPQKQKREPSIHQSGCRQFPPDLPSGQGKRNDPKRSPTATQKPERRNGTTL